LTLALPLQIARAGNITIGSNLQSPPNNFYGADGKTPVGFEVDLAKAMGAKLGLTVHYIEMSFGSLITSLQSGRLDLTMARMNAIEAREPGSTKVLPGIDLSVHMGQVVCVADPSGAGKSAFLRRTNQLETIDTARCGSTVSRWFPAVQGKTERVAREVAGQRRDIGMVFQRFNPAHRRALENVTEGPVRVRGVPPQEARRQRLPCWTGSAWRTMRTTIRSSCPAGNRSGWRSRGRRR
jgi:hypothetical protein